MVSSGIVGQTKLKRPSSEHPLMVRDDDAQERRSTLALYATFTGRVVLTR
jgi:hypothetical protein